MHAVHPPGADLRALADRHDAELAVLRLQLGEVLQELEVARFEHLQLQRHTGEQHHPQREEREPPHALSPSPPPLGASGAIASWVARVASTRATLPVISPV
ncbi:hypothetical protein SDC9_151165 [bioreactor metagenome]|uniref:Uncharacterized protein n=1 Tax=bioreactor metagenome TaxID=1076179 RepID=A0A645ERE2_9ZZZZ